MAGLNMAGLNLAGEQKPNDPSAGTWPQTPPVRGRAMTSSQ
jgi:hypothetical protein